LQPGPHSHGLPRLPEKIAADPVKIETEIADMLAELIK
jgi:hypothetical protein